MVILDCIWRNREREPSLFLYFSYFSSAIAAPMHKLVVRPQLPLAKDAGDPFSALQTHSFRPLSFEKNLLLFCWLKTN